MRLLRAFASISIDGYFADAVAAVAALKTTGGPDITILGSGSLVAQLGAARLVDAYQFVILPIALGAGRTVFSAASALQLEEHRAFPCGRVVVTYRSPRA